MTLELHPGDALAGLDLIAEFEKDMGADLPDPHPVYAEERARGAVVRGDLLTERLGLPSSTLTAWQGQPFTIVGYHAVEQVMRDAEHFSNTVHDRTTGKSIGRNILTIDDPEHREHRKVIQSAFSRKAMERWRAEFIEPEAGRCVDVLAGRSSCELMSAFALNFPISVIHHIVGMPAEQLGLVHNLAAGLLLYRTRPDLAMLSSQRLGVLINEQVDRLRDSDSFLGVLVSAHMEGGRTFSREELISFIRVLFSAGGETTARTIGTLFAHLTQAPELLDAVRADRGLVRTAIEEAIRIEAPTQYVYRLCIKETTVDGQVIPAGSPIAVALGSANRDESVFPDAGQFRLNRTEPHLSFGHGVHLCLGMHLARVEASAALNAFLDRLPRLRADDRCRRRGSPGSRSVLRPLCTCAGTDSSRDR